MGGESSGETLLLETEKSYGPKPRLCGVLHRWPTRCPYVFASTSFREDITMELAGYTEQVLTDPSCAIPLVFSHQRCSQSRSVSSCAR